MTVDPTRAAFLAQLSGRHPELVIWKHLDRALRGRGDIDAAAPEGRIAAITADALAIAPATLGATWAIRCDHVADKHLLFYVQPDRLPQLFEFDMCVQPSRGLAPWAEPQAMQRVTVCRADGIRALSPGAEAVVSLVYHGVSRDGGDRLAGDERAIVDHGITTDLDGAYRACAALAPRPARRPLRDLVRELSHGEWSPTHSRWTYAAFVGSAAAHPAFLVRRMRSRARLATGRDCVMSRLARLHDRRVPDAGLSALLDVAARDGHQIVEL